MSELSLETLRDLVHDIAADPERWSGHVRHDPEQRTYELLRDDEDVTVWLICWSEGHDTGFHDHDISQGAVHVVSGELTEERLRLGVPAEKRRARAGETFTFPASGIHRVHHPGGPPAVTIHAYSPPLRTSGAYSIEEDGTLRRFAQSERDELRPRETAGLVSGAGAGI